VFLLQPLVKLVLLRLLPNAVEFVAVRSRYGNLFRASIFLVKITLLTAYAKDCLFRLKIDLSWLIKILLLFFVANFTY